MPKKIFITLLTFILIQAFLPASVFGAEKCQPCCATDCVAGYECIGYDTAPGACVLAQSKGVGECQPNGSVTFCPFSKHQKIEDVIDAVSKWIFILALVIAPLMVLLGGFYMLTSAGDPTRSTKGKKIIIWAMVGLGVILFAKAFISLVRFVLK